MRLLFLIPLLGVVFCAPISDEQQDRNIVKRDEEAVVFGNQQNPPKVADAIVATAAEDANGSVHAAKPEEVNNESKDEKDKNDIDEEDSTKIEKELTNVVEEEQNADNAAAEDNENENEAEPLDGKLNDVVGEPDDVSESPDQSESDSSVSVVDPAVVELENMAENEESNDDNDENAMIVPISEEEMGDSQQGQNAAIENEIENIYESPYNPDTYNQYDMYQNFLSEYPLLNSYLYRSRFPVIGSRRRRAAGRLLARLRGKEEKRSHRIKRDLPYEDDIFFNPYYFSESEVDENPYNIGYEGLYETPEEELLTYPELEAVEEAYEKRASPYDDVQEIMYDGEPGYFVPTKRQDMLSFVPGNKRENYFYPESIEPKTHFSAFVPEKRDYLDTYSRLVRLARALAMQPGGRERLLRGYEWE